MASAKQEAINSLGDVNNYISLDALNKEREVAQNTYNTNKTSIENEYNNLLNTIANNRTSTRTDFNKGRNTVRENSFLANRTSNSDLASRGVGTGGLKQLSELGNRMETGSQYSNLANTFYNTMKDIDTTQDTGTKTYNTNLEGAQNTLDAYLADIGTREANARNAYNQAVATLAEQIQSRRQAAASAAASRNQAAQLAKTEQDQAFIKALTNYSADEAVRAYMTRYGGTSENARIALYNLGLPSITQSSLSTKYVPKSTTPATYSTRPSDIFNNVTPKTNTQKSNSTFAGLYGGR